MSLHSLNRSWRSFALRLCGGLAALLALGCAAFAIDTEADEAAAIRALQAGGHVVYLRHADRHKGPKETLGPHSTLAEFADCSRQRNLTEKGRAQAEDLGRYFKELSISFDQVLANAPCRTRDTALIAFGKVDLEPRLFDPAYVKALMSSPRNGKANTILIGNDYQFQTLTGIELDRAEAVVVKPDGRGSFVVLARLDLDDWREAAEPGW